MKSKLSVESPIAEQPVPKKDTPNFNPDLAQQLLNDLYSNGVQELVELEVKKIEKLHPEYSCYLDKASNRWVIELDF